MPKSMKNKTKILYFVDTLEYGGIQTFIYNVIKNIKDVDIDILTLDDGNTYPLENEIKRYNINIYKLNIWLNNIFKYSKYKKEVNNFFKKHNDYKVIHLHATSKHYYILKVAKEYNINTRIIHSHAINFETTNIIKKLIGNILKNKLLKYATDFFACSKESGEWLFKNNKFTIVPNGIEIDKFKYNDSYKKEIIKEYNLENKFIIGTVSRLTKQKNPLLLIDILKEVKKVKDNVFLIIIGGGILEDKLKRKIKEYNLEKDVLLLKDRNDIYKFYNVFDLFLLTSNYEGFSISILEAQINGLKCIVNNNVLPREVIISNNVYEVNNIDEYKKEILNVKRNNNDIDYSKYDIKEVVKYLENYYQSR